MTTLVICSTLIGSVLGIRFRFPILLPVIFLGSIFLVIVSIIRDEPASQALWSVVVFAFLLQLGYVAAAWCRHAVTSAHAAGRLPVLGSPRLPSR